MGLARFAAIRAAATLAVALLVSVVLFAAVELLPGDAAITILGQNATPERVEELRTELRLDDSAVDRYATWIGGVVRGDLGESVVSQRPVWSVIETPARNSLLLGILSFSAMLVVAVALGVLSGRSPGGRADRLTTTTTSAIASVPDFVMGGLLIVLFATWIEIFPAVSLVSVGESPLDDPIILVLPAATLALVGGSFGARLIRAVIADEAATPHVDAAVLAGLSERRIVLRHLLPGVIGPIAQVLASLAPYAVGGAIVVERLFGYPGIGAALVDHLAARDVTVVEAIGLILTAVVLLALFTADLIGAASDPRRRSGVTAPDRADAETERVLELR
ncbi:MAG: ABC transporter permease [Actinomycetota bacterium]